MDFQQAIGKIPVILNLKDVDENPGPFCMSFGFDLRPLIRSIEKSGLINAPIVTSNRDGRLDVVAGYRRILALKSLKMEKIPCRDLSNSGLSPLELLLFSLYDNLATREFNEVEMGMILNRLMPFVSRKEIREHYMPLLNLPSHDPTLDIFLKLEELDLPIRVSLGEKRISFQGAKALIDMDPDSRSAISEGITKIKFNFNQQMQFIEHTRDISIKEGKPVSELLGEEPLVRILEDGKLNNPQKAKLVLHLLRSRRFPFLSRSEKAFQKKISTLGLPDGVRISHSPFFEGPDYRLEILFKEGKELKSKIDSLGQIDDLDDVGPPWQ